MNNIKSRDLCDRCVYNAVSARCGKHECKDCEQHDNEKCYCKGLPVLFGTPCPYFKEASDE